MQFIMTIKKPLFFLLLSFISLKSISQTNDLSSSPYSLYGLGLLNNLNTGVTNTLGKTGIAMPSNSAINNLNPASFSAIPSNHFLYEVGVKIQQETLVEDGLQENRTNANFSSLAFAFPVSKRSAIGLSLLPYTNVGYFVTGVANEIEGSNLEYIADIYGTGGLNEIKLNYGYSLNKRFRIGVSGSFFFGKIEENETNYFDTTILYVNEENFYNGFQFSTGLQYDFNDFFSLGAIVSLPTKLNGNQENTVFLSEFGVTSTVEESEEKLDSFKLPFEVGLGLQTKLKENFFMNIDYKRSFWDTTNQKDQSGDFVDQDFVGIGTQYIPSLNTTDYWKRVHYRAGINFDSGYLQINDTKVSNYEVTVGLGLPFNKRNNSMINIGYSYGQQGRLTNGLIQENYHLVSINLSLENIWFVKRFID